MSSIELSKNEGKTRELEQVTEVSLPRHTCRAHSIPFYQRLNRELLIADDNHPFALFPFSLLFTPQGCWSVCCSIVLERMFKIKKRVNSESGEFRVGGVSWITDLEGVTLLWEAVLCHEPWFLLKTLFLLTLKLKPFQGEGKGGKPVTND